MTDIDIPSGVENIIFDLGGVILNIDYNKAAQKFKELGCLDFDELYSQQQQSGLFDQFETGKISPQEFTNKLLTLLPSETKEQEAVDAWNAMLLDLYQTKELKS